MTGFRIYRAAFAPAVVAVVVLLFSLPGRPAPLPPVVASAEFDQRAAAEIDRQITEAAPARSPGSEGDRAIADLVAKRFAGVREGQVAEQRFDHNFEGEDLELRNVVLTLPGESARSVVVLAARDSASGPGAASSAAATAGPPRAGRQAAYVKSHEDAGLRLHRRRQRRCRRGARVRGALPRP